MNNNNSSTSLDSINLNRTPDPSLGTRKPTLTSEIRKLYLLQIGKTKSDVDSVSAKIQQRQEHMKLINEILDEINLITDEKNSIDINKTPTLIEKLEATKKLGVKLEETQKVYNGIQKDRLVDNLTRMRDTWGNENRQHTQQMEIYIKDMDRIMMIMKDVDRKEEQAKRASIKGISGG
jgi:hypothetical protein